MASVSPPMGGGRAPGVGVDDQRFLTRSLFVSRYWSNSTAVNSISLCRHSAARYEQAISPIPMDPTEIAIDEGIARLLAVLREG